MISSAKRVRFADYYPSKASTEDPLHVAMFIEQHPKEGPIWIVYWWVPVLLEFEEVYRGPSKAAAWQEWLHLTNRSLDEREKDWFRWLCGDVWNIARKNKDDWYWWSVSEWLRVLFPEVPQTPPSKAARIVHEVLKELAARTVYAVEMWPASGPRREVETALERIVEAELAKP